jgi:hypothetical protein
MTKIPCSIECVRCPDAKGDPKVCLGCMYREPSTGLCVYDEWKNC